MKKFSYLFLSLAIVSSSIIHSHDENKKDWMIFPAALALYIICSYLSDTTNTNNNDSNGKTIQNINPQMNPSMIEQTNSLDQKFNEISQEKPIIYINNNQEEEQQNKAKDSEDKKTKLKEELELLKLENSQQETDCSLKQKLYNTLQNIDDIFKNPEYLNIFEG